MWNNDCRCPGCGQCEASLREGAGGDVITTAITAERVRLVEECTRRIRHRRALDLRPDAREAYTLAEAIVRTQLATQEVK